MNKLPIYRATINMDDESGMYTISLVEEPAVEIDFLYFDKDIKPLIYSVENEEQRKVTGVVMTCDTPIYRRDENGIEYYIVYDRKTIEMMAEKYLKQNRQSNVDLNHSFELEEGIYMNEIFIKDSEKGISPKGFEDVKDGSLMATFHIENDAVWAAIKEGTFKGFSLSGLFGVEEIKTEYNKQNNNKLSMKLEKLKSALKNLLIEVEMGEITTSNGVLVWNTEEDLKEGDRVRKLDVETNTEVDAEDGEYRTEDKKIIIVKDGIVVEIKDDEAEVAPKEGELEEEQPKEEPIKTPTEDERDARIKELEAEIEEKKAEIEKEKAEIEALKARIAELENEPAAKSAQQEFETVKKEDNTPKGRMAKRGYVFN